MGNKNYQQIESLNVTVNDYKEQLMEKHTCMTQRKKTLKKQQFDWKAQKCCVEIQTDNKAVENIETTQLLKELEAIDMLLNATKISRQLIEKAEQQVRLISSEPEKFYVDEESASKCRTTGHINEK